MRTKNEGFSLIESLAAIVIIGLVLTPIFTMETTVFNAVVSMAEQFHRTMQAGQFLFIAAQQQPPEAKEYSLERKDEKPISMIKYRFKPIDKKSKLAGFKNLYQQEAIANGRDKGAPEGRVIQFVFKPDRPTA